MLLDPRDELLVERKAVCRSLEGVTVRFRYLEPDPDAARARVAALGYGADWIRSAGAAPTLSTRLDDDDALAPDFVERLCAVVEPSDGLSAWLFPKGYRVWDGRYERVRHLTNAWVSLLAPAGETTSVYDFNHKRIGASIPVHLVDNRAAWLWVRHLDTLSRHRVAWRAIDRKLRRQFPIDWDLLDPVASAA